MGTASRGVIALLLSLQLAGCGADTLISGPPPDTYDLTASIPGGRLGHTKRLLAIREPRALQILDSERIVFRPEPARVTYIAGAQWTDRLPKLVEARLVAAFEGPGGVRTVTYADDGLAVQFNLLTEVRDFSVRKLPEGTTAAVSIYAKLASDYSGRAVTGQLFEASALVAGDGADASVAALDEALAIALRDIVVWTLRRI